MPFEASHRYAHVTPRKARPVADLVRVSWLVMHSVKSPCVSQLRGGFVINVVVGGGFGLDTGGGVVGVDPPPPQALTSSAQTPAALTNPRNLAAENPNAIHPP